MTISMIEVIRAFSPYFPWIVIFSIGLIFRRSFIEIARAARDRIASGSEVELKSNQFGLRIGELVKNTNDAKATAAEDGAAIEVFGNPDQLRLLFKVQGKGWKKSTKALALPGGCLVQVTTERQGADGSWTTAEALEFVTGVAIHLDPTGSWLTLGDAR